MNRAEFLQTAISFRVMDRLMHPNLENPPRPHYQICAPIFQSTYGGISKFWDAAYPISV